MAQVEEPSSRYGRIIEIIFADHFHEGMTEFEFDRHEINNVADRLRIDRVLNLGDLIYSFRFRYPLPSSIQETAPIGAEWIIEPAGRGKYLFKCARISRVIPRSDQLKIKIPESTPEIVSRYALGDEQALLAKVRYNRLIDIFLGITSYSLQNHLRTVVKGSQIEIDEIYVGVDRTGTHFVVPVQAKGGSDQIGVVQTRQDIEFCRRKFSNLVCRAVAAQFMTGDIIAMFELTLEGDDLLVVREKHFKLVASRDLSDLDLQDYQVRGSGT